MMQTVTLNKSFNYTPATNLGIFNYLDAYDVPWKDESTIAPELDYYYHLNHSGNKNISPLVEYFKGDNEALSSTDINEIAKIIFTMFGKTWIRLWEVYNLEYNPIQNYDMTEIMDKTDSTTYGKKTTRTDNLTETNTLDTLDTRRSNTSETRTDDLTIEETPEQTKTTEENVMAFNSSDYSPSKQIEETNGGKFTRTQTGTVGNAGEGSETYEKDGTITTDNTGTQDLEDSGTDATDTDYTLTRQGNIGVTTTQQMIQSELSLWQWNYFKSVVFPNIDGVLTTMLY